MPPFPGAVTEWSDGDFFSAYGWLELKWEAEKKEMDDAKIKAAEEKAKQDALRASQVPGGAGVIAGGGGGIPKRTSAHPVEDAAAEEE